MGIKVSLLCVHFLIRGVGPDCLAGLRVEGRRDGEGRVDEGKEGGRGREGG